jgi:hypothetical protein
VVSGLDFIEAQKARMHKIKSIHLLKIIKEA